MRSFVLLTIFILALSCASYILSTGNTNDGTTTSVGTIVPNTGAPVGIWFCNFFPNPGSMMVYVIPTTASANPATFVPNTVGSVPYGDCQYFPNWGTAGSPIQLGTYLSDPITTTTGLNTFVQFTPTALTNGNGVSSTTNTVVYSTSGSGLTSIPPLPANSATAPINGEAENQNIFVALPLTTNPPVLTNGYMIQSMVPPFLFNNPNAGNTFVTLLQTWPQITTPVRTFICNFASGNDKGNIPGYTNNDFDVFSAGGLTPNANWNANTVVGFPSSANGVTLPVTVSNMNTANVIKTPQTGVSFSAGANGQLTNNDVEFSVFGGVHVYDYNAVVMGTDPGFELQPSIADSGGNAGSLIAGTWRIHGNHPPFSITMLGSYGIGTSEYPYMHFDFTMSRTQQMSLLAYNQFLASQIQFAEKNNINPLLGSTP